MPRTCEHTFVRAYRYDIYGHLLVPYSRDFFTVLTN